MSEISEKYWANKHDFSNVPGLLKANRSHSISLTDSASSVDVNRPRPARQMKQKQKKKDTVQDVYTQIHCFHYNYSMLLHTDSQYTAMSINMACLCPASLMSLEEKEGELFLS